MSHDSIRGCVRPSVRRSVGRSVGRSVTSFSAGRNEDGERLISCIRTCFGHISLFPRVSIKDESQNHCERPVLCIYDYIEEAITRSIDLCIDKIAISLPMRT